jgi:AmiR/NasT family two-component response regulator
MTLKEQVYSVLVVSSSDSFNNAIKPLLPESKLNPVHILGSISAAKQTVLARFYDFVMINAPLPDDPGTRFAIDVCSEKGAVALLFVKNELYDEITDKVTQHGVYTLAKPTSKQMVLQAFSWMASTRERLRNLEKKTLSIEEKMAEIRLVNRAKWLLIDVLKMTEPNSHRYIEKQAMDRCVSRREIAESIIRTYGR